MHPDIHLWEEVCFYMLAAVQFCHISCSVFKSAAFTNISLRHEAISLPLFFFVFLQAMGEEMICAYKTVNA